MRENVIQVHSRKAACLTGIFLLLAGVLIFSPAQAVEVGWQKMIDETTTVGKYHESDLRNVYNCSRVTNGQCGGEHVQTPGRCGDKPVTREFYCAGPWRTYEGLWGIGGSYLFLSSYGANMPSVSPKVRKGWAVWQWEVKTSGKYKVEIFFRPTDNRSPDADYYVFKMDSLGDMDTYTEQDQKTINQRKGTVLSSQEWVPIGTYEYQKGEVAAVGLWAQDDYYSDEADATRWTLVEKIADKVNATAPANSLLLNSRP